jgi:hypothetical protein
VVRLDRIAGQKFFHNKARDYVQAISLVRARVAIGVHHMAMQTTQTTQKLTGRNAGARKGAAESNKKGNIGSHMTGKDQTPAVRQEAQKTEGTVALPGKALVKQAEAIIHGFRAENDKLLTIKKQAEAQRGGLSDIVFKIVRLGWENSKPGERFLFCQSLLDSAELAERVAYQKSEKLGETPTARVALGASWQTYKSQILKCVKAGYDPTAVVNGSLYRKLIAAPSRKPRTPEAGEDAGADTLATKLAASITSTLRTELQSAIVDFMEACKGSDEAEQLKHANALHKLTVKIAKANAANAPAQKQADDVGEQAAVGAM